MRSPRRASPRSKAARRWRDGAEYRALAAAFADCPLDAPDSAADRAERLLADAGLAGALLAPLVEALAADRFFEPPLRIARDAARTGAVLFDGPAATITASVTDATTLATRPAPATIVFAGRVTVTRYVKAGGATLRRWRTDPLTPGFTAADAPPCVPLAPIHLSDGDLHRVDGRIHAHQLRDAAGEVVMLVAAIRAGHDPLIREYRVADGALTRVASADDRASRTELLLTFLRLAGRADAGERFAAATHDPAFHLRWAAMREWLALDAEAALPRLSEMAASDPNAEVRAAATLTLIAVRRRIDETRCRA
ncbi:MAG: hypothetical protein WDN44_08695 [Sphingomonas sp.]